MKESVIYQEIVATADAQGFQRGIETGIQQGELMLTLRLLKHRVGPFTAEVRSQIEALSLEQIEALGEALLDFASKTDLDRWLQNNT